MGKAACPLYAIFTVAFSRKRMKRGSNKWKDLVSVRAPLVVPVGAEEELELRADLGRGH